MGGAGQPQRRRGWWSGTSQPRQPHRSGMLRCWALAATVAAAAAATAAAAADAASAALPAGAPSIVLFFVDDLGYSDLSCFGGSEVITPNIDRMAAEGMKLTTFYSAAPVCTPSRAGLLLGRCFCVTTADFSRGNRDKMCYLPLLARFPTKNQRSSVCWAGCRSAPASADRESCEFPGSLPFACD